MLKKKIAIPAMIVCGSLLLAPGLSQATPLSWTPGADVVAKVMRLWNLVPGHAARAGKPAPQAKNGVGIDPCGATQPVCVPAPLGLTAGDPGSGN
jgi:hypothetical protein